MKKTFTYNPEYFDPIQVSDEIKSFLVDLQDHDTGKLPEEIPGYGERKLVITVEIETPDY